jgi:hypothetical protein
MVEYLPLQHNTWNRPEPEPDEEAGDVLEPQVDVVVNTYHEKGDAKSFALKISIRLPLNA